jgi:hypothetical protein
MNEEEQAADISTSSVVAPQAEKLVSQPSVTDQHLQLPSVAPLSTVPTESQSQIIQAERQSRQELSSSSIEAKVCIKGKCELISKK